MNDEKYVGAIAAAKNAALTKTALNAKLDNTGGTLTGDLTISGAWLNVKSTDTGDGNISVDGSLVAGRGVSVLNGGKSVSLVCTGDNAAKIAGSGNNCARLAVGTPTSDNDATTKAYVDGKAHDYYDVAVTSSADAAQTIDGGIISVRGSADKTVAEISAAYAAGAIVRCIYDGNIMQLVRVADGSYSFAGVGANYGVARDGNITVTIMSTTSSGDVTWITSAAGELPIPDSGGSKNDCALVVKDGQWAYSADKMIPATPTSNGLISATDKAKLDGVEDGATKTIVDDAMSDTSTNPVQNKVVKKYIDIHGVPPVNTQNDTMLIQVVNGAYALRTKESIFPVDDALDTESKNAVENGVIARRFEQLSGAMLPATSKRDGLMTAANYIKLSGIETGANKTVVDATLDAASTNPVQNKAVKAALDGKAGTAVATASANGLMSAADKTKLDGVEAGANKITVDAALDAASENPVQNKAVKAALDSKLSTLGGEISASLRVGQTVSAEGSVSVGRTSADTGIHFEKAASDAGRISHGSDPMTGVAPIARLKVADPTEDDDATTRKYVDDRAVRHDAEQGLTSDQKLVACANIGAVNQKNVWTEGNVAMLPRGADGSQTINIMPSEKSNDYTLTLDAGPENVPVYVAGLETPTDAQTDYATNVAYVKAKIAEVAASGGVDVDNALSATSTNPVQNKVITSALTKKAGTAVATESANGLMSAADKKKLDGIAAGANKITIDSTMSGLSVNPVQNKVIKQYVDDKVAAGSNITVDAALSSTSTNPVQNKAVKAAIDAKADKTALDAKADKIALDAKMDKSGGTFTGNVYGKYFCGTWLQSNAASDLGRTPGKIAVLDDSGWVYYRTPSELFADLGIANAIKSYVDTAIVAAINSAY